jgi:hypothetical protein
MSNVPENLRPIKAAYLYSNPRGSIMIYHIKIGCAIEGPVTWQMNWNGTITRQRQLMIRL